MCCSSEDGATGLVCGTTHFAAGVCCIPSDGDNSGCGKTGWNRGEAFADAGIAAMAALQIPGGETGEPGDGFAQLNMPGGETGEPMLSRLNAPGGEVGELTGL